MKVKKLENGEVIFSGTIAEALVSENQAAIMAAEFFNEVPMCDVYGFRLDVEYTAYRNE